MKSERARGMGGKWDEGKYRIQISNATAILTFQNYTKIDGLQILLTGSTNDVRGIDIYDLNAGENSLISNNIVRSTSSGTSLRGIMIAQENVYNNIVYNFNTANSSGIYSGWNYNLAIVANNTIYGCTNGIVSNYNGMGETIRAVNNLVSNCTNNYVDGGAGWEENTDSNASSSTSIPSIGLNNRTSQTFAFSDEANDDFHLSVTDTGAKDYGAVLCADANLPVTHDIDGEQRVCEAGKFDIGADENTEEMGRIRGTVKLRGDVKFK